MTSKPKLDLAAMAFLEHQILADAARSGELEPSVRRQENYNHAQFGSLGSGLFINVRIISLLYFLFVVPNEIWLSKDLDLQEKLNNLFPIDHIKFLEKPKSNQPTVAEFVRHIRNSVSHTNFDFFSDYIEFWDRQRPSAPTNFRVRLSMHELEELLSHVGFFLANLRNSEPQFDRIQ